jgi:chaperonin cofactor prefoldin
MRVLICALSLALAAMPGLVTAAQAPSNQELSKRADELERRVERLERREKADIEAAKEKRDARAKAAKEKAK